MLLQLQLVCTGSKELDQQDVPFIGWEGETFDAGKTFSDEPWVELLSWQPRAYMYHNFFTAAEADHLIKLAKPHMQKSQVVDTKTGEFVVDKVRTSSGYFLRRQQDDIIKRLEQRIAEWTRLPIENGEPFHILRYQHGEKYDAHMDAFYDEPNQVNGGQRVATVLMYLSDVEEGGETVFPDSKVKPTAEEAAKFSECGRKGIAVKPRKGSALLFWSLSPDGKTKDMTSLHGGCPVLKGDKWSATKWIRVREHTVYN